MTEQEYFTEGQRVIFRRTPREAVWYEGKILLFVKTEKLSYYRVQEFDQYCESKPGTDEPPISFPGLIYNVPSIRACIKVLPKDAFRLHEKIEEAKKHRPVFKDPMAHIYIPNPDSERKIFNNLSPEDLRELKGVVNEPANTLPQIMQCIRNRRHYAMVINDWRKVLSSIIPEDGDVRKIFKKAKTVPGKHILQLADIFQFGLCNMQQRIDLASDLYMCAACGLTHVQLANIEDATNARFAYPFGSPEALCAGAVCLWSTLSLQIFGEESPEDPIYAVLSNILETQDSFCRSYLNAVLMLLSHAIRRGFECPFAYRLGECMENNNILNLFFPYSRQLYYMLETRRMRDHHLDKSMLRKLLKGVEPNPHLETTPSMLLVASRATEQQYEYFRPKATEIFLDLPVMYNYPWHIEFRELEVPPFPTVVLAFTPWFDINVKVIYLKDSNVYTPYSTESFEDVWGKIVFQMHTGNYEGGDRYRPPQLMFARKPGDMKFASFVIDKIGNNCNTKVRLVDTSTTVLHPYEADGPATLESIVTMHHNRLLEGMIKDMKDSDWNDFSCERKFEHKKVFLPVEELTKQVQNLKEEGNSYFTLKRYHPAIRCYSDAIYKIQLNPSANKEIHRLLGILLSNRAACFLNISKNVSQSAKVTLQKCIDDCDIVLNSAWISLIPERILAKIKKRRNEAEKSQTIIASKESYYGQSTQSNENESAPTQQNEQKEVNSTEPSPQSFRRSRRNRRKGGKNNRRQRRRKQKNEEQSQDGSNPELNGGTDDNNNVDTNDTNDATEEEISILLGLNVMESKLAKFISHEDTCPICIERFGVELSDTFVVVNSCGHACCLPCLTDLWKRSKHKNNTVKFECTLCQHSFPENVLIEAVESIVFSSCFLQDRLSSLPLTEDERASVARELFISHSFVLSDVFSSLDEMLTDNLQKSIRRLKGLTPLEKKKIYEDARRPVDELWKEASKLRSRMVSTRDLESEEYANMKDHLKEIQTDLIPTARKVAMNSIWKRMNTVGMMGTENDQGEIEVDFHALHVDEAKTQFDKRLLPILQATQSVLLIVGRGNNSEGGVAKLKPSLKRYIENHIKKSNLVCTEVQGNDGALRIRWKSN